MPDDDEVHQNIDDERMENLSRPRSKGEFDDEDGENLMEYSEEEFVSIKLLKPLIPISWVGMQEIDAGDLETLDALLPANAGERKTLADLIFAKLDNNEVTSNAAIQKVYQGEHFVKCTFISDRNFYRP